MFKRLKYNDKQILQDINSGGLSENKAIAYIIKNESNKIMTFVRRNKGSQEDAEDIFQEGLTTLVLNIHKGKFKRESALSTYLFAICKNIWFKKLRKYGKYESAAIIRQEDDIEFSNPESIFLNDEQRELILTLFDQLKDKCKEVLQLWGLSYSMKEIAETLGYKNEQVVMNKKNICLKELHNKLQSNISLMNFAREIL